MANIPEEKREIIILRKEFISENFFHINVFILLYLYPQICSTYTMLWYGMVYSNPDPDPTFHAIPSPKILFTNLKCKY